MFSESMETKQLMMSKSFPAIVVTAVSKVSLHFYIGAYFPPVVHTFHLSGAYFPPVVHTFHQWCILSTSVVHTFHHTHIFISLTLLIGPKKVSDGKSCYYECSRCKNMCRSERYDKENQCCARLCVPFLSQEAIEQLPE
jgi:hypothetical protein